MAEASSDIDTPIDRMKMDPTNHDQRNPPGPAAKPVAVTDEIDGSNPMIE